MASLIAEETRTLHAEILETAASLLGQVEREIAVLRLSGQRTLPFGGSKRASEQVQRCAEQLQEALAVLNVGAAFVAEPEDDLVLALHDTDVDLCVRCAHLAIRRDETLLGIAEVRETSGFLKRAPLVAILTDQRLLMARESKLLRFGEAERTLNLAETTRMQEMSRSHQSTGGIKLEAGGQLIEFEYRAWAAECGEPAMKIAKFATLLRHQLKSHPGSPWSVAELERNQRRREAAHRHLASGPPPGMDPVSYAAWAAQQLRAAKRNVEDCGD